MKITVIFGDIDFSKDQAIIRKVDNILMIEESIADEMADRIYEAMGISYIIPTFYHGQEDKSEIIWREE